MRSSYIYDTWTGLGLCPADPSPDCPSLKVLPLRGGISYLEAQDVFELSDPDCDGSTSHEATDDGVSQELH